MGWQATEALIAAVTIGAPTIGAAAVTRRDDIKNQINALIESAGRAQPPDQQQRQAQGR